MWRWRKPGTHMRLKINLIRRTDGKRQRDKMSNVAWLKYDDSGAFKVVFAAFCATPGLGTKGGKEAWGSWTKPWVELRHVAPALLMDDFVAIRSYEQASPAVGTAHLETRQRLTGLHQAPAVSCRIPASPALKRWRATDRPPESATYGAGRFRTSAVDSQHIFGGMPCRDARASRQWPIRVRIFEAWVPIGCTSAAPVVCPRLARNVLMPG